MTFSVKLPIDAPTAANVHRIALAGLRLSFSIVEDDESDIVVLTGDSGEWLERTGTAIDEGIRAVVVHRPGHEEISRVEELRNHAESIGVRVEIYSPYVWYRAWMDVLTPLSEEPEPFALIDSLILAPDGGAPEDALRMGLLDQLAVVRPLLPFGASLEKVSSPSPRHYILAGADPDPAISLCGVATVEEGDGRLQVDVVSQQRHWRVIFSYTDSAQPVEVTRMDEAGQHTMRPIFESACRASWRSLFNTLESESPLTFGLEEYADCLVMLGRLD